MSTRSSSHAGMHELNATPLIDVLLVLLIIFLVMIPTLMHAHSVKLPRKIGCHAIRDRPLVIIKLHADLTVSIDDGEPMTASELAQRLPARAKPGTDLFVDFDGSVPWNEVIATVDTVRSFANRAPPDSIPVAVRIRDGE